MKKQMASALGKQLNPVKIEIAYNEQALPNLKILAYCWKQAIVTKPRDNLLRITASEHLLELILHELRCHANRHEEKITWKVCLVGDR